MRIDHVHFYVEDAVSLRDWFVQRFGFQSVVGGATQQTQTEIVRSGAVCFVISSPLQRASVVAEFLRSHPPGVADVAFQVQDLDSVLARAVQEGAELSQPVQERSSHWGCLKWSQIQGWGSLSHTLLERTGATPLLPTLPVGQDRTTWSTQNGSTHSTVQPETGGSRAGIIAIDHLVLNVPRGMLKTSTDWYQRTLGFEPQQRFKIQTEYSGLSSQVLVHPAGTLQLPINEPASANSQIQEFLEINRGAGIQHIALQTQDLIATTMQLRQWGVDFLPAPLTYYQQLQQRQGFAGLEMDLQTIATQEILVDWQNEHPALLLQIFTQPIFEQPTFFFELIERQVYWCDNQRQQVQGFGEGNFQALFRAIEQEQINRGSIALP